MSNRIARRAARRASLKQESANRENAKFSTGPVTVQGRAISSANATKHGLTSMKPYLPAEEQDYVEFATNTTCRYDPQTPAERNIVGTIIDVEWRLKRIPALEARLFASSGEDEDVHKAVRSLDTLSRHETRLRKLLVNTIVELHGLVQIRRKYEEEKALASSRNSNGFVLHEDDRIDPQPSGNGHEGVAAACFEPDFGSDSARSGFVSPTA